MEKSSSSSSSTSDSSDSYLLFQEQSEGEDARNIFDIIYESDNESLEEEEPEYILRRTLEEEPDFFATFSEVPELEDIEEDVSVVSAPAEKPQITVDATKDVGKFVHPLTGLEEGIESLTSTEKIEQNIEDEAEDDEISQIQFKSEDSEIVSPEDILDEIEEKPKTNDLEDTLEALLEMTKEQEEQKAEEIDWEAVAHEELKHRLFIQTRDFVKDLIDKTVEIVEQSSPEKLLKKSLDKRKILKELLRILPEYNIEKRCGEFLNRQITTYYRQKQSYRNITPDNPKVLLLEKQKFFKATQRLDKLLMKKNLLSSPLDAQNELKAQYQQSKKIVENLITSFENKVKENLHRENAPKLNILVEQLLMKIQRYRKEISKVRFSLLVQQHTQATLLQSKCQLEDLGNGLNLSEFYNLQAETQAIDKKVEERNNDIIKLCTRGREDIHCLSHIKEKEKMVFNYVVLQNVIFERLVEQKRQLRENVYTLQIQNSRLKKEIKKLIHQGGILDKPILMHDYDATVEYCREQQEVVNYLRQSMQSIETELNYLQKQCPKV